MAFFRSVEIALGQEMEGLQGWRYPYQRVIIDDKIGEIVGFWKQVASDAEVEVRPGAPDGGGQAVEVGQAMSGLACAGRGLP